MSYPAFDKAAHPALTSSLRVDLQTFHINHRDYSAYENPPILHRKETFVGPEYPKRDVFARLTKAEEAKGLLDQPSIGYRRQWSDVLAESGLQVTGHRLAKVRR